MSSAGIPLSERDQQADVSARPPLPKGVVLDKDGKPCRTCTSFPAWRALQKQQKQKRNTQPAPSPSSTSSATTASSASTSEGTSASTSPSTSVSPFALPTSASSQPPSTSEPQLPPDCPADVETLGRHTWTFLHTLTATYPPSPSTAEQTQMSTFLKLFSNLYPCGSCAEELRSYMKDEGGPRVGSREEFGRWMCEAHNSVNRRLGKEVFDCALWEKRWRTGWGDGRCGEDGDGGG